MLLKHSTTRTANLALFKSNKPDGRIGDFGNFLNIFAKSPLLPCIPHRSRLFCLNSPDIMEFSS